MHVKDELRQKLDELLCWSRETYHLGLAHGILEWDHQTMMPAAANEVRARTSGVLSALIHSRATDKRLGELIHELSGLQDKVELSLHERAQIREATRKYRRATAVPEDLVREMAEESGKAHQAWLQAREARDFGRFQPSLEKIVTLKRREAEYRDKAGQGDGNGLYSTLLGDYEPGMTEARLQELFDDLRDFLTVVVHKVAKNKEPGIPIVFDPKGPSGPFPKEAQRSINLEVIQKLGFDLKRGRVDLAPHPFCMGIPVDTRLTVRYDENNPLSSFFALIHEAGHGMYVQGMPTELIGTPAGDFRSFGVHESQSLMWENFVASSREFWEFFLPQVKQAYPGKLDGVELESFYRFINRVQPSLIRVDADEVTYPLHVIIRFEIERELIDGQLNVAELPGRWNDLYDRYLGIRPPDDRDGVLQDVHWSWGNFGYFPTYAIGNLMAAQLFAAAERDVPGLHDGFAKGSFEPLLNWVRDKVHHQVSLLTTDELLSHATGSTLTTQAFKDHIGNKVQAVYGLSI